MLIINTSVGWLMASLHPKNFLSMGVEQPEHGCSTPCHYVEGWCECPLFLGGGLISNVLVGAKNAMDSAKKFFSLAGVYALPTPGASSPLLLYLERTHRPARSPNFLGSPITAVRNASMNFFSHDENAPVTTPKIIPRTPQIH